MRTLAALAAAAVLAGCSSSGPSRPAPPIDIPPAPTVVRWEPVTEATDGSPVTDITRYEIEASAEGQAPTRRSENPDTRAVQLQLPSGAWTVRVTAVSESRGPSDAGEAHKVVR